MLLEYLKTKAITVKARAQFPSIQDRHAWNSVLQKDSQALLEYAKDWRDMPYPMLTAGMYAAFVRTGDRKVMETPYFARRLKLCAAFLHLCLTNEDTDLQIVEDGLYLICEETTWAVSAHLELSGAEPYPDDERPTLDLFAAQTAMTLSLICQIAADKINPALLRRVKREVSLRVLHPFMNTNDAWWMGFIQTKLNNWTPWIVSNVLSAANVWDYDYPALLMRGAAMLDRWLTFIPADGGCDEGVSYWGVAAGAFLDCLQLMELTADIRLWDNQKLQNMLAYPEKMSLGDGWYVNFADCGAKVTVPGERLLYAGEKINNPALIQMGITQQGSIISVLGGMAYLSRLLLRLFHPITAQPCVKPTPKDVWMPDLQVRVLEKNGMILCAKGGNNNESHNHNDVGSFVLAVDGKMRIVDAGNMVYTAKTFSDKRYELWTCRAAYHNIPMISEIEQCAGAEYAAKDAHPLPDGMSLVLTDAYPAAAKAVSIKRSFHLNDRFCCIADEIVLEEEKPVTWVFMFRDKPEICGSCCRFENSNDRFEW